MNTVLYSLVDDCIASLDSPHTRAAYTREIKSFLDWLENDEANASLLLNYRHEQRQTRGDMAINLALSAIRKFYRYAGTQLLIARETIDQICAVPNIKTHSAEKSGNWLTKEEAEKLLHAPPNTLKGRRDRAILALLVGCGLRRAEAAGLRFEQIEQREGRWAIVDLIGKGNKPRTIPMPVWSKAIIDQWAKRAAIHSGVIIRRCEHGKDGQRIFDDPLTTVGIWRAVELYSTQAIGRRIAPHDLRRTYAKLSRRGGAHLEQIQITLGHSSLATTEKYLGREIDFQNAPGDQLGLDVEV